MASPSVTYTFSNSTTADASQVNQNFTDIINGITDGTKDLSISALTVAGTATLNGNVAIGNSSADTLTITSVLSSSIPIGTTYSYDIGSATVGLRSMYLGSADSAAKSTRIIGATVASSWTLTTPTSAGTSGYVLSTNGSGVTSWVDTKNAYNAQTASYTLLASDTTAGFTTSTSSLTATLPTAVGASGKRYTITKVDSGSGKVTLLTTSSQTIGGYASNVIILGTQKDSITVESDGSNWQIVDFGITVAANISGATPTGTINGSFNAVIFPAMTNDPYGSYNATTGLYTVVIAGFYCVDSLVELNHTSVAAGNEFYLAFTVDGTTSKNVFWDVAIGTSKNRYTLPVFGQVYLNAGQTISIRVLSQGTTPVYASALGGSSLSISMVR